MREMLADEARLSSFRGPMRRTALDQERFRSADKNAA